MKLRAPYVRRGQALTADLWNGQARAINQGLAAPRDQDAGIGEDEVTGTVLREVSRETDTVRVFNPDDENQWVDVLRITSLTVRNGSTGEVSATYFDNDDE